MVECQFSRRRLFTRQGADTQVVRAQSCTEEHSMQVRKQLWSRCQTTQHPLKGVTSPKQSAKIKTKKMFGKESDKVHQSSQFFLKEVSEI